MGWFRKNAAKRQISCLFCGRRQAEVEYMISGPDGSICEICVRLCVEVLDERGIPTRS